MGEPLTVDAAWNAVMRDVQGIKKGERNKAQGFNFRGIDTVVNAVGPVLREHGVTIVPAPEDIKTSTYETAKGTTMFSAIVKMRYIVRGPAGDSFEGGAFGEAADAGDKAVSKAQSVAYRVFLLQGLTIPTDEPDPDTETHQRASAPEPVAQSGPVLALQAAAAQLSSEQRTTLKETLVKRGLPGSSKDMSEDEAKAALSVLNETFAA